MPKHRAVRSISKQLKSRQHVLTNIVLFRYSVLPVIAIRSTSVPTSDTKHSHFLCAEKFRTFLTKLHLQKFLFKINFPDKIIHVFDSVYCVSLLRAWGGRK